MWCSITPPQLSRLQWNSCPLILNTDVLTTTCPGRFPLLLMRQEEPKHMRMHWPSPQMEQYGIPVSRWRQEVDPGMDIDVVETQEVELADLLNVVTRDVVDELKQNEKDYHWCC